jgi:hypothetical protein
MVRQILLSKLELWKSPKLFTLTVDRSRFPNPRAAFDHITSGKFIARLMRDLGIVRWLWVLEFQTLTGEGWPHWHLMIDVGDLPRRRVDLKRAWGLWRDRWRLGGLDLAKKETKIQSAEHAVFYITMYLTKMPRGGFPLWVLGTHGIRFVQGSEAVGPLVLKQSGGPVRVNPEAGCITRRGERKSFLDATSRCRLTSRIWVQEIDQGTGETRMRFAGTLPTSPSQLVALSMEKDISADIQIQEDPETGKPLIVWVSGDVETVRRELLEQGAIGWQEKRAARARDVLLAANVFVARQVDKG